jgi:hypothetical protein
LSEHKKLICGGRVIAVAGADDQVLVIFHHHLHRMIETVGDKRLRPEQDAVLMPQFTGDI